MRRQHDQVTSSSSRQAPPRPHLLGGKPAWRLPSASSRIAPISAENYTAAPNGRIVVNMTNLTVVGGGLAGCEAAWQAANRGLDVTLYEMRPGTSTGAHVTADLAELVCSNSLGSSQPLSRRGPAESRTPALGVSAAGMRTASGRAGRHCPGGRSRSDSPSS